MTSNSSYFDGGLFPMCVIPCADPDRIDFAYTHMDLNVLVSTVDLFHLWRLASLTCYRFTERVSSFPGTDITSRLLKTN